MRNNLKIRKIKDVIINIVTYLASSISVIVLLALLIYIFSTGTQAFSFKMLTSDYYQTNYFGTVTLTEEKNYNLENTSDTFYSNVWGIGLKDEKDFSNEDVIAIVYIASDSPLYNLTNTVGDDALSISVNQIIEKLTYVTSSGTSKIITPKYGAKEIALAFDEAVIIEELYFASVGGGIRGSIVTTIYLILLTLIIVLPLGILAALYLAQYAKKNKITNMLRTLIDMISGVPSIIFGMVALIIFIPFVNSCFKSSGGSIVSGALTLSIMLLPVVIRTTEEAINTIPKSYTSASLALGASFTQTTFKVILPNALSGILTSTLLAIGRIIGESAALIFAIGTVIKDDITLRGSSTTLAVHIWTVLQGENPNYSQACAVSIVILFIVLVLNILVKLISKRLNKFEVK